MNIRDIDNPRAWAEAICRDLGGKTADPKVRAILRVRTPSKRALAELAEPLKSHCRDHQGIAAIHNDATGVVMCVVVSEDDRKRIVVETIDELGLPHRRKVLGAELDQVCAAIRCGALRLTEGL